MTTILRFICMSVIYLVSLFCDKLNVTCNAPIKPLFCSFQYAQRFVFQVCANIHYSVNVWSLLGVCIQWYDYQAYPQYGPQSINQNSLTILQVNSTYTRFQFLLLFPCLVIFPFFSIICYYTLIWFLPQQVLSNTFIFSTINMIVFWLFEGFGACGVI